MTENVNLSTGSTAPTDGKSLASNTMGLSALIFQGMGQVSPIGIFGGSILGAAAFAMGATPLAFILGMFAALLSANTVYQYSKKVASARGYYGYVGYGLGRGTAFVTSYLYVLYQIANLCFIYAYYVLTFSPTFNYVFGTNILNRYGLLYIILIGIPSFAIIYFGIRPSYLSQMVFNSIQIIFVVAISFLIIATVKDNTLAVFSPAQVGWNGVFLGFITGSYLAYAGYGSIVPLGEEAKTPHRSIGIATLSLVLIISALYLLGSYAMVVGWGYNQMSTFSLSIYPGFQIISQHFGYAPTVLFFVLNFAVVYPVYVGMATAVTRNIYSMARDGFLPRAFYGTHPRWKSPHRALGLALLLFFLMAGIGSVAFYYAEGGFINGFFDLFLFFATASTISTLAIHFLVNSSLSVVGDPTTRSPLKYLTHYVFPVLSSLIVVVAVYYAVYTLTPPLSYSPILVAVFLVAAVAAAGALWSRIKRTDLRHSVVPLPSSSSPGTEEAQAP